jgi:hypothetical protein
MKTNVVLGSLLIAFFVIPFLPHPVLALSDLLIVRVALLALLVAIAYVSPIAAVLGLVVIALVFVQRGKYRMQTLKRAMQLESDESSPAIEGIQTPATAPEQPPYDVPEVESHPYSPQDDSGDNSFEPVGESINHKQPLPTESADGSRFAIQQLFEWVNPTLAQSA